MTCFYIITEFLFALNTLYKYSVTIKLDSTVDFTCMSTLYA